MEMVASSAFDIGRRTLTLLDNLSVALVGVGGLSRNESRPLRAGSKTVSIDEQLQPTTLGLNGQTPTPEVGRSSSKGNVPLAAKAHERVGG
jgi:hypothetical protein